ncbi:MAG TPA: polysaccharide biosynthesis protein [Christensenellaceae bacterium]|nr:polysaccharide biosynthesis protein [Christensenellaceae bacterium]
MRRISSRLSKKAKGKQRVFTLFLVDVIALLASYAFILQRIALVESKFNTFVLVRTVLAVLACTVVCRIILRVQNTMWRYASAGAFLRMVLADFISGWLFLAMDRSLFSVHVPFASAVAAICVGLIATLSLRFVYQLLRLHPEWLEGKHLKFSSIEKEPIAIVGAGSIGVLLARELIYSDNAKYTPYCFIDNDERKIGTEVEGIPVMGPDEEMVEVLHSLPIKTVVIAIPNRSHEEQRAAFEKYKKTGCQVRLYDYPLSELPTESSKRAIRDVRIEDLLFRDIVSIVDDDTINAYHDKTILITGAGGSIGGELTMQLASCRPQKLILLDIFENGVYDIEQELLRKYRGKIDLEVVIATVCNAKHLDYIFEKYKPDVVFHAAAHKHVPLMENNSAEAIRNNVFGTYNVINASEKLGIKRFILISTDKAVNPTNVMGATKRLCEMIIQSRIDSETEFVAVRFGNVLGSSGSVVPLFKKQISEGGPVTITDKRIIRYFMAIPEAVQLVLRAGSMHEKGKIYVLDMGKPVRILDLAENLIYLSGFRPYKDIDILEVGLRPGEKLYEELLIKTQECIRTNDKHIFIEKEEGFERREMDSALQVLRNNLDLVQDNDSARELLKQLVPTYCSADEVNKNAISAEEFEDVGEHSYLDSDISYDGDIL